MKKRSIQHIGLLVNKRYTWSKTPRIKEVLDKTNAFLKAYYTPSLSIMTIAALTPREIEISYIDENFEDIDYNKGYDIVGITAMTQEALHAYNVAAEFRKRGVYVVMGGIHASVMPEEAARFVDTVIIGEAERLWPQFLSDYESNCERKFYYSDDKVPVDLTMSPIPRYDLLHKKNYFMDPHLYYNMVPIQTSRGCPHDCQFCLVTKIYGNRFRTKTMAQIESEIIEIKKYFPGKILLFSDDNLFVNKKHSRELLTLLKRLNIRWWAQSDIGIGDDDELLTMAYESGCLTLLIGLESINPENLKTMNKSSWKYRQLVNYGRNIDNIQKHGIIVFGSFIFGLDNDDKRVFKNVVTFMDEHNITGQLTIATPLPGSRLFKRLHDEQRMLAQEPFWDRCTFLDVLFKPKNLTVEDLEEGFLWAYSQVFNKDSFDKRSNYLKTIYKNIH